ncbi:MAG: hypothetical protein ACTIL6_10250 [Brevibacterium aurantiacum]|uniref:hypothetical protein n=1 Tax=Brevibacterium aurantiacum TaxID=273384 RepID=UPI003F90DF89
MIPIEQPESVPSLVDCSIGLGGYRERMTDSVSDAPTAIIESLGRHGIGAVHSTSATWEEYWTFLQLARENGGPSISGGGAALTDESPASHRLRWVTSLDDIKRAVATSRTEGFGWVTVQSSSTDFISAVAAESQRNGVRMALRGPGHCAKHLSPGDVFLGFIHLLSTSAFDHPVDALLEWATEEATEHAIAVARELGENGVGVTTELVSHRRAVFIREGLKTPFLETLEPILPHTRHIREMNRPGGYLAGKHELKRATGLSEPNRLTSKRAQISWGKVLEACEATHRELTLLPGTRSPQITTVPGYSLKEELSLLAHLGCPLDYVLDAATTRARTFFDIPDDSSHRLSAETNESEDPTTYLLSLRRKVV